MLLIAWFNRAIEEVRAVALSRYLLLPFAAVALATTLWLLAAARLGALGVRSLLSPSGAQQSCDARRPAGRAGRGRARALHGATPRSRGWRCRPWCSAPRRRRCRASARRRRGGMARQLVEGARWVRREAAAAIATLARNAENQIILAAQGAGPKPLRLPDGGGLEARLEAAAAIANLTENAENHVTLAAQGTGPKLLRLLDKGLSEA